MQKIQSVATALCALLVLPAVVLPESPAVAATIQENFSGDPLQNGWQVAGNTNLFQWDPVGQNLRVTWDSTQTNSYFCHLLGTTLTRSDDFGIEFDLLLNDIASGNEPGKTGGLEIALGFLNRANAANPAFLRGVFGGAPSLVEFDYFPPGYYDVGGAIYDVAATTTPTFISTNSSDYAPNVFAPFEFELPTNLLIHVSMNFTAGNQTLVTLLTTNGQPFLQLPAVVLTDTNTSGFSSADDYRVDEFSITSYSSAGDDYDSVLAHGIVDNLRITFPEPVQNLTGAFSNSVWEVQFLSRSNWLYTLERTTDFQAWTDVGVPVAGNATNLFLQDVNPVGDRAFYRVRATQP